MGVQRYDIPDRQNPGEFIYRVWTPMNSPIKDGREDSRRAASCPGCHPRSAPRPHSDFPELAELRKAADVLGHQFPTLPAEAVLGVLTHSHSVVVESSGARDFERAEALAKLRLETHAGHPADEA